MPLSSQGKFTLIPSIALFGALCLQPIHASETTSTELQKEARSLAQTFQGQLKPALKKGMQTGGPSHAIEVCKSQAPQIAKQLSQQSGWQIQRVSLKPRGANGSPDQWEEATLNKFNAELEAGKDVKTIEYGEMIENDGQTTYRYMKAISTAKLCLTCHGTNLNKDVQQTLDKLYPNDQATGFNAGDIRGAFSFQKVLDSE